MNLHAMFYFLAAAAVFCLGIFVVYKNAKSKTNVSIFLLVVSTILWQAGSGLTLLSKDLSSASFYTKMAFVGIIFIPISTYHLTLGLLNIRKTRTILVGYILAFLFLAISQTRLILDGVNIYPWGFFFKAGPLHPIFMAFFLYFMILSFLLAYSSYKKEKSPFEKNRRKYFFIAIFIAYIGIVDYVPTYGGNFFPFSCLAVAACVPIFSYAIIAYRLNDIEVIIRETAVFAGIFGFSVGVFMLAMMAGQQFLQPYLGGREWIIPAVALFVVTIAVRPIERLVYKLIGRFLFKKKYEYQKTLQDAAVGMATVRDPRKLLQLIVHIVSMKMKVDNVSILIYDDKQKAYQVKASRGEKKPQDDAIAINEDEPLIEWLREHREPILLDELQKWISDDEGKIAKNVLSSDLRHMQQKLEVLNASVCVPSFYRKELLGVLVLGNKKSGDFFKQDDLDLFNALADEAAIAIKNSQLYFEIDKRAKEIEELYKREHRLFMHASVAFAAAIDARDPYTHGHSERVTNYSIAVLDYLGPTPQVDESVVFRQRLQIAAVLHDIGKIGIPDYILHKPTRLSTKEQKEMERHPVIGAEIVSRIKGLHDILGGIKYHHERYDGRGYPDSLRSENIPFMARIIAVADTYDAMTSSRPYRKGLEAEIARAEIQKNTSTQFDPYMVAAFLKAFEEGRIDRNVGIANEDADAVKVAKVRKGKKKKR